MPSIDPRTFIPTPDLNFHLFISKDPESDAELYAVFKQLWQILKVKFQIEGETGEHQDLRKVASFYQNFDMSAEQLKLKSFLDNELQSTLSHCKAMPNVQPSHNMEDYVRTDLRIFSVFIKTDDAGLPTEFVVDVDHDDRSYFSLLMAQKIANKVKNSDMSYLEKIEEINNDQQNLMNDLVQAEDSQRQNLLNTFNQKWQGKVKAAYTIEPLIKKTSCIKEHLLPEDVESAILTLKVSDGVKFINLNHDRSLTNFDFMHQYKEPELQKRARIYCAKEEEAKKPMLPKVSANVASFFAKHPYMSAGLAAGATVASVFAYNKIGM